MYYGKEVNKMGNNLTVKRWAMAYVRDMYALGYGEDEILNGLREELSEMTDDFGNYLPEEELDYIVNEYYNDAIMDDYLAGNI